MAAKVDLYNSSYSNYALSAYSEIRVDTYGEDYGQTSWVTTAGRRIHPTAKRCWRARILQASVACWLGSVISAK